MSQSALWRQTGLLEELLALHKQQQRLIYNHRTSCIDFVLLLVASVSQDMAIKLENQKETIRIFGSYFLAFKKASK